MQISAAVSNTITPLSLGRDGGSKARSGATVLVINLPEQDTIFRQQWVLHELTQRERSTTP